jgi:phosphatidylserine/phosphatidylglycerophosphate/cardiolipin synthase-like enzyme
VATSWREALQQTLLDYRVTRSEKRALQQLLNEHSPSESEIHLWRSDAFEVARAETESVDTIQTLEWLEDVMRLLAQAATQVPAAAPRGTSEAHFSPGQKCLNAIRRQLDNARHSIDICVFTITDDRISRAIEDAVKRRVLVKVISDDMKSGDAGSDIRRMSAMGVPVRIDRSPFHMHHKFAIFDNKTLLTGSYNWTRSAADSNEENLVVLNDKSLIQCFQRQFDELWEQCVDWID